MYKRILPIHALWLHHICLGAAMAASAAPQPEVFKAKIFELGVETGPPLYTMERLERKSPKEIRIEAVFKDRGQKPIAREEALVVQGVPISYRLDFLAQKETGTVEARDGRVFFRYLKNDKWKEDSETLPDNLVIGPTLTDYLESHWETVLNGQPLKVRFALPDRLETVGFKFVLDEDNKEKGEARVLFRPTSIFIQAIVRPLVLTVDRNTGLSKRIVGRTFLRKQTDSGWEDLLADTFIE